MNTIKGELNSKCQENNKGIKYWEVVWYKRKNENIIGSYKIHSIKDYHQKGERKNGSIKQ
jgi:hypothetical protein